MKTPLIFASVFWGLFGSGCCMVVRPFFILCPDYQGCIKKAPHGCLSVRRFVNIKDVYLPPFAAGCSFPCTSPEISRKVSVGMVFAVTVTRLLCGPGFPFELNSILISAVAPGGTGSFGQVGTVQPQDPFALLIIKGSEPVFLNLNMCFTTSPSSQVPKLNFSCSYWMVVVGPVGTCVEVTLVPGMLPLLVELLPITEEAADSRILSPAEAPNQFLKPPPKRLAIRRIARRPNRPIWTCLLLSMSDVKR